MSNTLAKKERKLIYPLTLLPPCNSNVFSVISCLLEMLNIFPLTTCYTEINFPYLKNYKSLLEKQNKGCLAH